MVGNHVADLVTRYGESGEVPAALTDYIKAREGYDYSHHGKAGNPSTDFVPDEIVDRFCILGPAEYHVAKLTQLKELGVDQFNIYLMHDAMEATLDDLRAGDNIRAGERAGAVNWGLISPRYRSVQTRFLARFPARSGNAGLSG